MTCPHLMKNEVYTCVSDDRAYIPHNHQLTELCNCGSFQNCAIYKSFKDNVKLFSYSI